MTKNSFRSIIKSFTFLAFITLLTSCEGFFTNNGVDDKIRAAIDYANTPFSTFVVSADSNAGTIIPSGQVQYKPTDLQNIEFTCNATYEFLGWDFSYKQTAQAADTPTLTATDKDWWKDYITIIKETESEANKDGKIVYTLQIRFDKAAENLLIQPKCGKKPQVEKLFPDAPSSSRSVSRDTEISITFDSLIDPESINGSIIIKVDGVDCTDSFTAPVISTTGEGNSQKTTIILNPIEQLDCPPNGTAKVTIELKDTIKTLDGVSLTPQILVYYIDPSSSIKSYVDLGGSYEGGTLSPNSSPYEFDNKSRQLLTFNENANYKFLHWESNNTNIIFDSDISDNPIMFYTLEELKRIELAKITPVYVKRPVFREARYSVANATVQPRDTNITLVFDNIPSDATLKIPDGTKFSIECTGKGSVVDSFKDPIVLENNKNQIFIEAYHNNKRIQVTEPSDVYITIPDSIYYVYHDDITNKDVNVTLGKSVRISYTINNTTIDKTRITYSRKNGNNVVGNLYINNGKMAAEESADDVIYNIGETVSLKFEQNSDYEFLYWNVIGNDEEAIEVDDKFSSQTSFTVKGAGVINIYPKCAPKIKLTLVSPNEDSNPCDSDIILESNIKPQAFGSQVQYSNSYNAITVTFNGNNVTSNNYNLPVISEENGKIYIKLISKQKLPVPANSPALPVYVKVDGTLFYNFGSDDSVITSHYESPSGIPIKITNNGDSFTFNVTEDTKNKVYVKFQQSEGLTIDYSAFESYKDPNYSTNNLYAFNEASQFVLNYSVDPGYQFIKWNITNGGNNLTQGPVQITSNVQYGYTVNNLTISKRTSTVGSKDSYIVIGDDSAERLKVEKITPENITEGVERDSSIKIIFNKKPNETIKNKIHILCDGNSADDSFNLTDAVLSETQYNGKSCWQLLIQPNTNNRISVSSGTKRKVKVVVPKDSFYLRTGETTPNIILGTDYEYEYTINEKTDNKAKVQFRIYYGTTEVSAGTIKCEGRTMPLDSTGEQTYYMDGLKRSLSFTESEDYQFLYWATNNTSAIIYDSEYPKTDKEIKFNVNGAGDGIIISAYCAPRLRVSTFTPSNSIDGVAQDSDINLTFNHYPADVTENLNKIIVYRNEIEDNDNYKTRSITTSTNSLKITTLKITESSERFVTTGTQTVKVRIPSDLYYTYKAPDDVDYPVYYGGSTGKDYYYTINPATTNKVTITTSINSTAGSITLSPSRTDRKYSIGESFSVTYVPNTDYKLTNWTINSSSTSTLNYSLTGSDGEYINPLQITVSGATQNSNRTITATATYLTKISQVEPEDSYYGVPCDSTVKIYFNKKMNFDSLSMGSDVIIYDQNNNDITSFYQTPTIDNTTGRTIITMNIKSDYSIKRLFAYSNTADIKIKLNTMGWKGSADTVSFSNTGFDAPDSNHIYIKYRINNQTEAIPPAFSEQIVSNQFEYITVPINDDTYTYYYIPKGADYIPADSLNPYNARNIVNTNIYFKFKTSDSGSGIDNKITIEYKKISDKYGNPYPGEQTVYGETQQYPIYDNNTIKQFVHKDDRLNVFFYDGYVTGYFPISDYIMNERCMLQINFTVYDIAGNTTTKTYNVVLNREKNNDQSDWYIYNRYFTSDLTSTTAQNNASTINTASNNYDNSWRASNEQNINLLDGVTDTYVFVRIPKQEDFITFNNITYSPPAVYGAYILYSTNPNSLSYKKDADFIFDKGDYSFAVIKIPADKQNHIYLKIYVTDLGGFGSNTQMIYIPHSPTVCFNPNSSGTQCFNYNLDFEIPNKKLDEKNSQYNYVVDDVTAINNSYSLIRHQSITKQNAGPWSDTRTFTYSNSSAYFQQDTEKFIFESRFLVGDFENQSYIQSFKIDLRSPASDPLVWKKNSTTLPTPTLNTNNLTVNSSNGYSSGLYTITIPVTNASNFPDGTIFTVNNFSCSLNKTNGTIQIQLPNKKAQYTFLAHCDGYKSSSTKLTIDLSYPTLSSSNTSPSFNPPDNLSPMGATFTTDQIKAIDCIYLNEGVVAKENISDRDGIGIKTYLNNSNLYEYTCTIIPENATFNIDYLTSSQFENRQLKMYYSLRTENDKNGSPVDLFFPVFPIAKGCKTYVLVSDKSSNKGIFTLNLPSEDVDITDLWPIKDITYSNTSLSIKIDQNTKYLKDTSVKEYYKNVEQFDKSTGQWNNNWKTDNQFTTTTYYNAKLSVNNNTKTTFTSNRNNITESFSVTTMDTFYRCRLVTDKTHTKTVYYYRPNKVGNEYVTGTYHNLYTGANTVTILCDAPTLYYCCYSNEDYGDDIDQWELYGAHTPSRVIENSCDVNTSEVPLIPIGQADYTYYVVIAHFANNTTAMSNVLRKNK